MAESCGLIVFNAEMCRPSKAVADQRRRNNESPIKKGDTSNQRQWSEPTANIVQRACSGGGVRAQVIAPELGVSQIQPPSTT
jgi:hypothetical protein